MTTQPAMRVWHGLEAVPAQHSAAVVTIGKFDGVHLGHQAVIDTVVSVARRDGLEAVAVTFDRNPLRLLAPEKCPPDLTSLEQKLALLARTGLDATVVLPFDRDLAATSAEDFVARMLVGTLGAKRILVGSDFRFGARNAGTIQTLRDLSARHGYTVQVIDDVRRTDAQRISSSGIRCLLAEGDVAGAARLLGRLPAVDSTVVPGARRGRTLGFPTANLAAETAGMIPADGVYAGWLTADGRRRKAAVSVGGNPTFTPGAPRQVEVYVLDADLDLYGKHVCVEFAQRIRGMTAFASVEELIARMRQDVAQTRTLLS